MKIRKGDRVRVLNGKDRGKEGEVMFAFPTEETVIVDGVNIATKHQGPSPRRHADRDHRQGDAHQGFQRGRAESGRRPTHSGGLPVRHRWTKDPRLSAHGS